MTLTSFAERSHSHRGFSPVINDWPLIPEPFLTVYLRVRSTDRAIVQHQIRPKHVIAVHISPGETVGVSEQVKRAYPCAFTFTRILETKSF